MSHTLDIIEKGAETLIEGQRDALGNVEWWWFPSCNHGTITERYIFFRLGHRRLDIYNVAKRWGGCMADYGTDLHGHPNTKK